AEYAQAEQTGHEHGQGRRLGDRIEYGDAGYRNIRRGWREWTGAAVGASERGQGAVEGRERIAAAKGVCSRNDIAVDHVVRKFELELRVGERRRGQSHLIDNCVLTVSLVHPMELQQGTGIRLTQPNPKVMALGCGSGAAKEQLICPQYLGGHREIEQADG